MLIFYLLLFVLPFWGCKFSGKGFFKDECLSKHVSDSIKGFFIWLVFLSHFSGYVQYSSAIDVYGKKISLIFGQMIVSMFLFYSGYGICESIKKKGNAYVKALPKNRILKTFFHFNIAVLIFLVIQLCIGNRYSLSHIILGFIGWEAFGNSNWYIFVILVLYFITYVSFVCFKDSPVKAGILTTMLTAVLVVFLYFTRWSWWYDTALCYLFGMFVSIYKDKFISVITKNNLVWLLCLIASLGLFAALYWCTLPISYKLILLLKLLAAPVFCLIVTILLTKVKISNKFLSYCGQHLFEIYILQRIPMILLKQWGIANINIYLYFILCVILTFPLTIAFRIATNKIDTLLFKAKK